MSIKELISNGSKKIAILIDPDKMKSSETLLPLIEKINVLKPAFIFVGGSTVEAEDLKKAIELVKANTAIPVVIFPGSHLQVDEKADAILFLSLISGRNPDFLIGHQIEAAPILNKMNIEVIPTGYMLVDGGKNSSVAYVSQTTPIPQDQFSIAVNTALAAQFMGMQTIFMDAGSGAVNPVSAKMISEVKQHIKLPLIVGGGMSSIADVENALNAGADIAVIGNKIEREVDFLLDLLNLNTNVFNEK